MRMNTPESEIMRSTIVAAESSLLDRTLLGFQDEEFLLDEISEADLFALKRLWKSILIDFQAKCQSGGVRFVGRKKPIEEQNSLGLRLPEKRTPPKTAAETLSTRVGPISGLSADSNVSSESLPEDKMYRVRYFTRVES